MKLKQMSLWKNEITKLRKNNLNQCVLDQYDTFLDMDTVWSHQEQVF